MERNPIRNILINPFHDSNAFCRFCVIKYVFIYKLLSKFFSKLLSKLLQSKAYYIKTKENRKLT